MAHHQLGHQQEATLTLARLRATMKQPQWAGNKEFQGFLREAEALIEGRPTRATRLPITTWPGCC